MQLKVILVEPKYQINLGSMARVSKNFGVKKLHIVRPRANLTGHRAIMFSKHARDLLENAKVYKSFEEAIMDCDITIATTGLWRKGSVNFKNVNLADKAVGRALTAAKGSGRIGLIIGRDDIGLTIKELSMCDLIAYIGTDEGYPVMNISHALCIFLYLLTKGGYSSYKMEMSDYASRRDLNTLFRIFRKSIEGKNMRDRAAVGRAFARIIRIAKPTREEAHALITALK